MVAAASLNKSIQVCKLLGSCRYFSLVDLQSSLAHTASPVNEAKGQNLDDDEINHKFMHTFNLFSCMIGLFFFKLFLSDWLMVY